MKILSLIISNELNAGPKAPRDIIKITQKNYNAKSKVYFLTNNFIKNNKERIKKLYLVYLSIINKSEPIIVQYPFIKSKKLMKKLGKNNILLIHDLNSLRFNAEEEIDVVDYFKYIICHNDKMKEYLISRGIKEEKIFVLELFDYLCNENSNQIVDYKLNKKNINVAYAGNLIKEKSPFLYQLDENKLNYKLQVYGVGISQNINNKIIYNGSYKPEVLPNKIKANFGLVWDGNFDESDENIGFKNYTKYNNPHKLSCYLAAGIPVIVWKKAAISNFVEKYNVGYSVNNLYEINDLDFSDYENKKKNAIEISKKVRSGYFTKKVIDDVLNSIKEK